MILILILKVLIQFKEKVFSHVLPPAAFVVWLAP